MQRAVLVRPEARDEAAETRTWYEGRQAGLGDRFTNELDRTVRSIAENPFQFPRARHEIRRAVLDRFPYAVYYRVTDTEIIVLAVQGRQDPARWQSRT